MGLTSSSIAKDKSYLGQMTIQDIWVVEDCLVAIDYILTTQMYGMVVMSKWDSGESVL